MAMGIVSDEEFDKEVNKIESREAEIIDIKRGRGHGNKAVPESLKKLIGETGELDSRREALSLGKAFDVSPSSVSAYTHGATSTASYNEPSPGLKEHIDEARNRIQKKARGRLFNALKHITDEKLSQAKVRDVSAVAKDMSSIIKDMDSDSSQVQGKDNRPNYIYYSPQFRDEKTFETIIIKE